MVLTTDPYTWGTGRRKTSVARVRLKSGSGQIIVNGREPEAFFTTLDTLKAALRPLEVIDV